MLIEDKKASQSFAAMDVNVGSWSEPNEWPGLAHFMEHMLFISSKSFKKK